MAKERKMFSKLGRKAVKIFSLESGIKWPGVEIKLRLKN